MRVASPEAAYQKGSAAAVSFDLTQTLKKNGTYTVTAKDYYGNEAVKTFTIKDTKKPAVSGVKNGKTYIGAKVVKFKDNCGHRQGNAERQEDQQR